MRSIRSRSSLAVQRVTNIIAEFIGSDDRLRAALQHCLEDEFDEIKKEVVNDLSKPAD
jgi:hypothetical protein